MTQPQTSRVPRWLTYLGSAFVGVHFAALLANVIAAPSGPWPTPEGPAPSTPPQFAFSVYEKLVPYLRPVRLTHNFHFISNRPGVPDVAMVAKAKDEAGNEVATFRLPDPTANRWVQHRQALLVRGLGDDQPMAQPGSEVIAGPSGKVPEFTIWEPAEGQPRELHLRSYPQHLLPRDRLLVTPSPRSLVLARTYARHLARSSNASTVEIVRHSKDAIPPLVLFLDTVPPGSMDELVSNFGELRP